MIQSASLPIRFKPSNISYNPKYKTLELLKKKEIFNIINLKKNNHDDENDDNDDTKKTMKRFINILIYNIILYSYIYYHLYHLKK
jgi:hypothetical protein